MSVRRRDAGAPGALIMSHTCKTAADALAQSPLAGLIDQARLLARVASAVADFTAEAGAPKASFPPLRCALQDRTVVITAGTPSQAAKLRQRAVALEQALRASVPEVTGIRIRLQLGESADPVPATSSAPSGPSRDGLQSPENLSAALRFADDLCRDLHDSPLRRSARRLRASLRARLDRQPSGPGDC